jgi:hypothetical protein
MMVHMLYETDLSFLIWFVILRILLGVPEGCRQSHRRFEWPCLCRSTVPLKKSSSSISDGTLVPTLGFGGFLTCVRLPLIQGSCRGMASDR